uniref:CCN family member 3 n=1 Tax=Amphiprion ocellaris TaxID=80972 RepID=A0AAQ5Z9Q9_AMPOC
MCSSSPVMSWLLLWILTAAGIQQAYSLNSTAMPPATAAVSPTADSYNRTQYCKWPCECPEVVPKCPPGVSLLMDGCDCCKTCARQVGEVCNEADTCDYHKGLYCDYSSDKPRYEKGVCASYPAETRSWHKNCITQTTSWSPCSKTCGRGLSMRISNANEQCELVKESRLCNLRPCEVDITKHIKPGKKCLNIYREDQPSNLTISGCTSKKQYRPKYCGVCTDERCCIPYKSKTIDVEFECPNGTGFTWKMMWVQACFCNLSCKNPNDIFAELESYYGYPEVMN